MLKHTVDYCIANGCYDVKFWAMTLVPFSEVMILINSCANFLLYYPFHKVFRAAFMKQKRADYIVASNKKPSLSNLNENFQLKNFDDSHLSSLKEKSYAKDSQPAKRDMLCKETKFELVEMHQKQDE